MKRHRHCEVFAAYEHRLPQSPGRKFEHKQKTPHAHQKGSKDQLPKEPNIGALAFGGLLYWCYNTGPQNSIKVIIKAPYCTSLSTHRRHLEDLTIRRVWGLTEPYKTYLSKALSK